MLLRAPESTVAAPKSIPAKHISLPLVSFLKNKTVNKSLYLSFLFLKTKPFHFHSFLCIISLLLFFFCLLRNPSTESENERNCIQKVKNLDIQFFYFLFFRLGKSVTRRDYLGEAYIEEGMEAEGFCF